MQPTGNILTSYKRSKRARAAEDSRLHCFQKAEKFRWKIKQSMHQMLISDSKHLWFYAAALKQVTHLKKESSLLPVLLLLRTPKALWRQFNISPLIPCHYQYYCPLKPIIQGTVFDNLKLYFSNDHPVYRQLFDRLGNQIHIHLCQIKINKLLNRNLFKFKTPSYIDHIEA